MRFSGPCYHNVNYGITLHRLWYWQCLQSRTYNAFPMCLNLVINSYYKNTVTILPILGRNCDLGNLVVSSQKQLWRSPAANMNTYPWVYPDYGINLCWGRVVSMEIKGKEPQHEISKNSVTIFPIIGRSCDLGNLVVSGHKQLLRSLVMNRLFDSLHFEPFVPVFFGTCWLVSLCGQRRSQTTIAVSSHE